MYKSWRSARAVNVASPASKSLSGAAAIKEVPVGSDPGPAPREGRVLYVQSTWEI